MTNIVEDLVGYLETKLRSNVPIMFEFKATDFASFWYDYITLMSSYLEEIADKTLVDRHNSLLYKLPAVAVVPRRNYYVVYVKKPKNFDDIYLAYNTAYVSAKTSLLYYVVPYIKDSVITSLVKKNVNPAVLSEVLYALPIISTIPCTEIKDSVSLIKDYLLIKSCAYLLSDDLAQNILGYLILKFIKMQLRNHVDVFGKVISFIKEVFIELKINYDIRVRDVKYFDTTVKLYVVILR